MRGTALDSIGATGGITGSCMLAIVTHCLWPTVFDCRSPRAERNRAPSVPNERLDAIVLTTIAIENYRSLRDLRIPLDRLNVITGANGTGKSSVYRALRLLADCGSGRVISSLAREGGLESVLWAGPERLGAWFAALQILAMARHVCGVVGNLCLAPYSESKRAASWDSSRDLFSIAL